MVTTIKKYVFIFLLIFPVYPVCGQLNYQIKKIEFEGNDILDTDILVEQINTKEMKIIEHVLFWKKTPEFIPIILDNDMDRLKSLYQRNGFLNARIEKELKVNDKKEQVSVVIKMKEGKPMVIKDISYREESSNKVTGILESVKTSLPLKTNERFQDKKVYATIEELKRAYKNKGYPFVRVDKDVKADTASHSVRLKLTVYPGSKTTFGEVVFKGDSLVSEKFLRKKLAFKPGEVYSEEKMEESQKKIFETGLFQYAIIRAQKDSLNKGMLPILIRVDELPKWSFQGGVGYGTEDRFRLSAELTKRQFLGGSRKLLLEVKRSYFLPYSLDVKFIQPDLFNKKLDFVLNPFFMREREESYEVERLGTGITIQKELSSSMAAYITYSLEQDYLIDKTLADTFSLEDKRTYNKSGVTIGMNKNSTDNIFEPTKGWMIDGYFTYMGLGFQSRYHYYKIGLETRHYKKLSPGYILAGKLHGGIIETLREGESTPIEDRFLIGGASSLRGWSRHSLSPKNEEGKAIGGDIMLQGSLELRFPIYDILTGAVFVDAGNVWKNAKHFAFTDLYYDVGIGVRVKTPIGPVRLDVAFPVFQKEVNGQFYLSLGHAF